MHKLKNQIATHDKDYERLQKSHETFKKQHAEDQYIQMNYLQEVAHLQDKIVALQSAANSASAMDPSDLHLLLQVKQVQELRSQKLKLSHHVADLK